MQIDYKYPNAETLIRSRNCEICAGQSGTGTGFSSSTAGFPLSLSIHHWSILISIECNIITGQAGEAWETCNRTMLFRLLGRALGRKVVPHYSVIPSQRVQLIAYSQMCSEEITMNFNVVPRELYR